MLRMRMPPFPRHDFPALQQEGVVYLDAAATTQKPRMVIDAVAHVDLQGAAPVHRALYARAEQLTEVCEQIRVSCAAWLGRQQHEIVMTTGATMGLNLIMQSWALHRLRPDDEIVIPQFEHHSNYAPWVYAAERTGARLKVIPVRDDSCTLAREDIERAITDRTRLVSFACHTNTFGPVPHETIQSLASAARRVGAVLCVDASQAMLHAGPALLTSMDPDVIVFSAHKMCGPSGVGVAMIAERLHAELRPWMLGGGMLYDLTEHTIHAREMPFMLEAGSPTISSWVGFGAALEYVRNYGCNEQAVAYEAQLIAMVLDGLQALPGVRILGDLPLMRRRGHMVSFALEGVHAHDFVSFCALNGIALRAGTHCAQPLHRALSLSATVRLSCAPYTTAAEVRIFLENLHRGYEMLRT